MDFLILLPLIPTLYYLWHGRVADAVLNVYLPVLLFVPVYYGLRIPHLPPLDIDDACILPIAVYLIFKESGRWRPHRTDLWIVLFAITLGLGETRGTDWPNGVLVTFDVLCHAAVPYLIARALMGEPDFREKFARRLTWLLSIVALLSVYEFRMGTNLFTKVYAPIFGHGSSNIEQYRWGFARVQASFSHAIIAGTVFVIGCLLSLWLAYVDRRRLGASEPARFGIRRSYVPALLNFMGTLIAQSRGPWLGAIAGFAISRIGIARNVRRTAIIVLVVGILVGGVGYKFLDSYTSGTIESAKNLDQQNAIYRRLLLDSYKPIVDAGGLFGWGVVAYPKVPGQESVDNGFLLLRLTQGLAGLTLFLLMSAESVAAILLAARQIVSRVDFYFAFALLGILLSVLVTMTTVSLMAQAYQLFFFFLGSGLALQPSPQTASVPVRISARGQERLSRRVFY